MNDIAADIGMSPATLHRAVQLLKEQGAITVTPAEPPQRPQTILIIDRAKQRSSSDDDLERAFAQMKVLLSAVEVRVKSIKEENAMLRSEMARFRDMESRVVSRTDLKNGLQVVVIAPKNPAGAGNVEEPRN